MNLNKKKPNILILLPEDGGGGAERVFWDQVESFSSFGNITPCLYTTQDTGSKSFQRVTPLVLDGKSIFSNSKLGRLLRRAVALNRLVRRHNIELVISHMDGTNWLNVLSCHGAKTILVVHGTVDHDQNIGKYLRLVRQKFIFPVLYNIGNVTVTVSAAIKREMQSHGVRNAVHIPNSFDIKGIRALSRKPMDWNLDTFIKGHYLLVASGRLANQKNFETLIAIFHRVITSGVDAKLLILGAGPLQGALEAQCEYFGIKYAIDHKNLTESTQVFFAGYCENPFPYIRKADLFLLPSKWEGFPLALCEAVICGTYAFSSDCPTGPREILSPGSELGRYELIEPESTPYGMLLPIPVNAMQKELWALQICKFLLSKSGAKKNEGSEECHILKLDKGSIEEQWRAIIFKQIRS